jgi:hypothetical protein
MNFLVAQQEVAAMLGLDNTDTNQNTLIKRWINFSYKIIGNWYPWSWLNSREQVVMETDYTTGTVSVAVAGTTATFSAVIATSQTNKFIQFSSAEDWYKITAHTAGTATATLETAYVQTTALVAGTYIIRKFYYSLSSAVDRVVDCMQALSPVKVEIVDVNKYDSMKPFSDDPGDTRAIILYGQDSSGNWTFIPYPFPSQPLILEFKTIKKVTELSSDSESFIFPARFDSILVEGACYYGYKFNSNDLYKDTYKIFYDALERERTNDNVGLSGDRVLQACDERVPMTGVVLPTNYDRWQR